MTRNIIRTNNTDKVTITFEEMKKITHVVTEYGNDNIAENIEYVRDLFNEVVIVTVPDNYEQLNRFSVAIGSKPLRKQAVVLKKDVMTGKLIPKTGWLDSDGNFEIENSIDYRMVEDSIIVLTYIYLMSEKNNDTDETIYDKSINYLINENTIVQMKKGSNKKLVRKVKIKSRKEIAFNLPTGDMKRIYNRISEAWSVRGHWREYKNGHRVWIKAYEKGKGEKVAKEYQI